MPAPYVEFTRGGVAESRHLVAWCVTDRTGAVLGSAGSAATGAAVFARSAVKPFQALPAVRAGVAERFGLSSRHLAIACASHGGGEEHLRVAREVLAAAGLDESALGCGPLEPLEPAAAEALRERGGRPSRITHNCSGKHALALAFCVAEGWPVDGYLGRDHPLQRAVCAAVAEATGTLPDDLRHGTDGCGMPTFHLPLRGLATGFARLASGELGAAGERLAAAMRAHPELVAFPGAIDTELMRAVDGLVAKVGAEGVLALGLPDGRGAALKIADGAGRAVGPAGVALVREVLGAAAASPAIERLARPTVVNSRGEAVGAARVDLAGDRPG